MPLGSLQKQEIKHAHATCRPMAPNGHVPNSRASKNGMPWGAESGGSIGRMHAGNDATDAYRCHEGVPPLEDARGISVEL